MWHVVTEEITTLSPIHIRVHVCHRVWGVCGGQAAGVKDDMANRMLYLAAESEEEKNNWLDWFVNVALGSESEVQHSSSTAAAAAATSPKQSQLALTD